MFGFLKKLLGGVSSPPPVTALEAQELGKTGAVILDVRSNAERRAAFIPGSTHIPLDELPGKLGKLPQGKTIICQCASGMRSAQATRILQDAGLDARNLKGGLNAWEGAGLPVKNKK